MFINTVDVLSASPIHPLSPVYSKTSSGGRNREGEELSRSASFTYPQETTEPPPEPGLRRNFSENILLEPHGPNVVPNSPIVSKELFRKASKNTKKRLLEANLAPLATEKRKSRVDDSSKTDAEQTDRAKGLGRAVTGTIKGLARRSWRPLTPKLQYPPQQENPSPERKSNRSPKKDIASVATIAIPAPTASRSSSPSSIHDEENGVHQEVSRPQRQAPPLDRPPLPIRLSIYGQSESDAVISRTPSTLSLRSLRSKRSLEPPAFPNSSQHLLPMLPNASTDRLSTLSSESTRRKDPLWGAFRALEGDLTNFQTKSSLNKTKIIRMSLLPFLSKYQDHPSNKTLRAEDLDRRISVLNKWWIALLDVLNGRSNQAISATDRPVFLEGAAGIMMRPEWRIPPVFGMSDSDRLQRMTLAKSKSSHSLDSTESEFLLESIYHNVRNTFSQNLLSQMAFVVERLSMRTAPASLVSFCGKACAYAFFFCPDVADILVRLWRLRPSNVRRIFSEFEIKSDFDFSLATQNIALAFPVPIRSLSIESQAAFTRNLQRKMAPPLALSNIPWYGPWIRRWSGRESNLFFVFTKYYHILVSEHLPSDTPKQSRVCIPGFIPLHAQILNVLESTFYRQTGQATINHFASSAMANVDDPDARIPLPLTSVNATRSMAENRLIMLTRDVLSDQTLEYRLLQELYLSSFDNIIKAATRRISLYNSDACFVLCDFMEEFLPIMSRYYQTNSIMTVLDWTFWLNVFQKMMESHNTLTQVRLITFLYTTWNIFTSDPERKRDLVLRWLLEPAFFEATFCHWCPMVRHYFHRLICWRLLRCDGEASELDFEILNTFQNLTTVQWAHYQYLKAEAEMRNTAVPSSAPCSPAPGRRLLILRADSQPLPEAVMTALDILISPSVINQNSPYQRHSSALNTIPAADSPPQNKKRWSLFKSILPFNASPGNARPGEVTPPLAKNESKFEFELDPATSKQQLKSLVKDRSPPTPPYRQLAFKFSLEWAEKPSMPVADRLLVHPQLPATALNLSKLQHQSDKGNDYQWSSTPEIKPKKPGQNVAASKYAGRALAEWELVVGECNFFFEKRREGGVPIDQLVETPALGVESFRISG